MSYTFSRRAFLKYSAATAVAVAGASLLGGCEYQDPKNPVCKTLPGAITSDLQVIAGLRSMKIENGTCTLEVDIESARANPIPLDPYRFSLAVKDVEDKQVYFSDNRGGVRILDAENSLIQQKKPVTLHLAAANFPKLPGWLHCGVQVHPHPREPRVLHDLGDYQGSVRRVHRKSEHQQGLSVS